MKRIIIVFVLLLFLICPDMRADGGRSYPYSYELTEDGVHICTMDTLVLLKDGSTWGGVCAAKKGETYIVAVDLVEYNERGKLIAWANRAASLGDGVILEARQNELRLSNGETFSFDNCLVVDNRTEEYPSVGSIKVMFVLENLARSSRTGTNTMNYSQTVAYLKRLFCTYSIQRMRIGNDVFDFGLFSTTATLSTMMDFLGSAGDWDL